MSRNSESRFALNPTRIDMSRSRFSRDHQYITTFDVGDVVPFYIDEVLPGDTFSVDTSKVIRLQTPLTPFFSELHLDTYFFFVPNRIVWEHWRELMGENTQSAWIPTVEYSVPQITAPEGGWNIGTIADYFGIPTGVENISVNALPFRAYALIMQEWFRDENLSDPLSIPLTDATVEGSNGTNYIVDVAKGGAPFKASKYHDYFTSALPSPQKGPDVTINAVTTGNLPVVPLPDATSAQAPYSHLNWAQLNGTPYSPDGKALSAGLYSPSATEGTFAYSASGVTNGVEVVPSNLWAINTGSLPVATINQLRTAFQIQKLYERDARGGTRYIEILKSHFGVTSPDARLQRPEYLGGNRIPINVDQVVQTSATESSGTPQGNTAAYSLTTDMHSDFTKSFVEHGFVIGVMVARYKHIYQQGIERFWSRKDRFDYYWPVFANLGEMAILNKELFAQGTDVDDQVFGYQEAWADYRYKPSRVTSEMRSAAPQSLDIWHLADDYESLPSLSDSWIREDPATVNRVLAVSNTVSRQLFADIFIRCKCTRAMPLYSVPGLIDHH